MQIFARAWRFCRAKLGTLDPTLAVCSTVLSILSLMVMIGGAEVFGTRVVLIQVGATVVGVIAMVILANIDYRRLSERFAPILLGVSVLLMIVLLIDGTGAGTNKSWLYFDFLPFGIQPTEFIKTALSITFAYHLSRVKESINRPLVVLGLAAHAGAVILLIVLTGDLGVALIFACFCLLMLFCAGLSLWYFAGGGALIAITAPILWLQLESYQQQRIIVGFRPELDPLGYGYQPLMSRDAITSGGFLGKGMFGGEVYEQLPASHTDFAFATACEKLGFFGGCIILIALLMLVFRIILIALQSERGLGSYLCVGLAACFMMQVIINVGMCFAVLPVVGITLPFISYGGSSVLGGYMMLGMAHSVCAHRNRSRTVWS
ncbi:MAG: FtsW/RodA/SpoVE family cell cycle protein [Clostridia bacterium]|nr:FtsW/RodA/SpoVE family cell cycle protein [Clostridia bacterium]